MRIAPVLLVFWTLAAPLHAGQILERDLAQLPILHPAEVIVFGEVHDNPAHHLNQSVVVRRYAPRALVFEMLTPEQAAGFRPDLVADADALAAALDWEAGGWPDFALYFPIFFAGQAAAIYGGALPYEQVRRAVSGGAAAAFGADAPLYGLDEALPPDEEAARQADQQAAHCGALPPEMLAGMVEAQRLRDAGLARAVLQALAEVGGPVVVIAGTGHARRDWGVPAALARAAPGLSVLSIGQLEADPGADAPFDLWLVTEPAPREDPCAVFHQG